MDLLPFLIEPDPVTRLGDESDAASARLLLVDPDRLDAARTPPSILLTLRQGGFLVWDPRVAATLANRGFSILGRALTAQETTWLEGNASGWVSAGRSSTVWFVACPGGVPGVDAEGLPTCGPPPGLVEVPQSGCAIEDLTESGALRRADVRDAARLAPPGARVCPRVFDGPEPVVSSAMAASARETVLVYDRLRASVDAVLASGRPMDPRQRAALADAQAWLVRVHQPVALARPRLFAGSANARPRARLGFEPLSTSTVVALVAVSLLGVALAIAWIADTRVRATGIGAQRELNASVAPMMADLTRCITDPDRIPAEREGCRQGLEMLRQALQDGSPTPDAKTDWGEVARWGGFAVGVGALVYLMGPVTRAFSEATADAIRDVSRAETDVFRAKHAPRAAEQKKDLRNEPSPRARTLDAIVAQGVGALTDRAHRAVDSAPGFFGWDAPTRAKRP